MNNQDNKTAQKENAPENKLRDMEISDLNHRIQHCSSEKKLNKMQENTDRQFNGGGKKPVNKLDTLPKRLNIKKEP